MDFHFYKILLMSFNILIFYGKNVYQCFNSLKQLNRLEYNYF